MALGLVALLGLPVYLQARVLLSGKCELDDIGGAFQFDQLRIETAFQNGNSHRSAVWREPSTAPHENMYLQLGFAVKRQKCSAVFMPAGVGGQCSGNQRPTQKSVLLGNEIWSTPASP